MYILLHIISQKLQKELLCPMKPEESASPAPNSTILSQEFLTDNQKSVIYCSSISASAGARFSSNQNTTPPVVFSTP